MLPDPPEMGNEDDEFTALLEFAAAGGGTRPCLCSHPGGDHLYGWKCKHRACGCDVIRPRNTASRTASFPAAGRGAAA